MFFLIAHSLKPKLLKPNAKTKFNTKSKLWLIRQEKPSQAHTRTRQEIPSQLHFWFGGIKEIIAYKVKWGAKTNSKLTIFRLDI